MSEQPEAFQPYTEEKRRAGNPNNRFYTEAEDERILEAVTMAEREGIPLDSVWHKLADEFDRSAGSVTNRYYKTLKQKDNADDNDYDSDDLSGGLMERLKNIVKERNHYKTKYESMKEEYDRVVPEYEKLTKELNKIRRMLGD